MAQELEHVKADLTSKCSELQSLQSLNQESAQNLQLQMIRNEDLMTQLQTIEKTKEELLLKQSEQEGQIQDLLNRVDHLPSQEIPVSEIQSTSDEKPSTINPDSSNDPSSLFNQNVSSPTFPQNVESVQQSAAASFFSSPQDTSQHFQESDAASYFNSSAQQSEQLQSPVASYFGSETPAVEPLAAEIQPEASQQQPEAVQQQPAASPEQQLPAVDELSQEQMTANLNWYQTELAGYQQACADWQVWGDEKTREIHELNEHLSYQTEAFRIKAAENEKLINQLKEKEEEDLKKDSGKKNDEQNQIKMKELEIADLKESVERLESEKQELDGEIMEMRGTIAELRSINDNVETYKDDSVQLFDTRTKLEEVEKERERLSNT